MVSELQASRDRVEELRRVEAGALAEIRQATARAAAAQAAAEKVAADQLGSAMYAINKAAQAEPSANLPWDSHDWASWAPDAYLPRELRAGTIVHGFPPLVGTSATLPVFDGNTLVFATQGEPAAAHARAALRSFAMRSVVAAGASVRLHLLDPRQEGFGFPERGALWQAAERSADVAADLARVVEAGYQFQARHPGRNLDVLTDQELASEVVHLVVALDFPHGYSHAAVENLRRVSQLGPAGVQLVAHEDLGASTAYGSSSAAFAAPITVSVGPDGSARGPWGPLVVRVDEAAPGERVREIAQRVPNVAHAGRENDGPLAWASLNSLAPDALWRESAGREAKAVFGRGADGSELSFSFGKDARGESKSHAVIAGDTGSGKSVMLHAMLLSLAVRHSPDDLRLYLFDGQQGATMQSYVDLPHAELVSVNAPTDLVRSVLSDLRSELERRSTLLTKYGGEDLAELHERLPKGTMPRLLVVIDEYQTLFDGDTKDATVGVLRRISEQGRKVGIHLVLASQRFHASGLVGASSLFNNVQSRASLRLPHDSIGGISEFARDGRELIREHCTEVGRVVVNAGGGAEGESVAGQVAYLATDERRAVVESLVAEAARRGFVKRPIVIDGRRQPLAGESGALRALAGLGTDDLTAQAAWAQGASADGGLNAPSWYAYDHPLPFVVGRTFTAHGQAYAKIDRRVNQNVMLVGSDPQVLTGMIATGVLASAIAAPLGKLQVMVLHELPPPGTWTQVLSTRLRSVLGARGHALLDAAQSGGPVAAISQVLAEIASRSALSSVELAALGPYLVVGVALERVPEFRIVDGDYGPELSAAGEQLVRVLKEGPAHGVHVVLGATSRTQWGQVLRNRENGRFAHRFVQQMSEDDSRTLLDAGFASRVMPPGIGGPERAGYVDVDGGGAGQVFLPYSTADDPVSQFADLLGLPLEGTR